MEIIQFGLITAITDFQIGILFSIDKRETAEILISIAKRYQNKDSSKGPISLHDKPKFETLDQMQLYVVQSLPQVGGKTAIRLLTEFSTIKNICNATVSDLEKATKSRKKAELLYKIFNTEFSPNNEKKSSSLIDFVEK